MGIFHCTDETHRRIKLDPVLYLRCDFIGIQRFAGIANLMMRNCWRCRSTLYVRMEHVAEMYPLPGREMADLINEYVGVRYDF